MDKGKYEGGLESKLNGNLTEPQQKRNSVDAEENRSQLTTSRRIEDESKNAQSQQNLTNAAGLDEEIEDQAAQEEEAEEDGEDEQVEEEQEHEQVEDEIE